MSLWLPDRGSIKVARSSLSLPPPILRRSKSDRSSSSYLSVKDPAPVPQEVVKLSRQVVRLSFIDTFSPTSSPSSSFKASLYIESKPTSSQKSNLAAAPPHNTIPVSYEHSSLREMAEDNALFRVVSTTRCAQCHPPYPAVPCGIPATSFLPSPSPPARPVRTYHTYMHNYRSPVEVGVHSHLEYPSLRRSNVRGFANMLMPERKSVGVSRYVLIQSWLPFSPHTHPHPHTHSTRLAVLGVARA